MHSLQQIKRSNVSSTISEKSNKVYKKYIDGQWQDVEHLEQGYYIFKNKDGIAYCKEKAPYDGNPNPFLNRSLNDPSFKVGK